MAIAKEEKQNMIHDYARCPQDTGSPEVQVALLTQRILDLGRHFQTHKKDTHSRRGLVQMVAQRRRLLDYLKGFDTTRYQTLVGRLGLRR